MTAPAIHGDRDDVLWLSGLLEGEGTFDAHRGKYPRVRLGMTDRDVVGRAASLMDASIRLTIRPAPLTSTWHTEVSGAKAAAIMREVLPFMGARRSGRIAEVLATYGRHTGALPERGYAPGPELTRPLGVAKPATAA